jgi:hypothetical protein
MNPSIEIDSLERHGLRHITKAKLPEYIVGNVIFYISFCW